MSEFKVGDRVMLEGVILPIAPYDNGFAVRMRGDDTTWNAITRDAMDHATIIQPEHDIKAHPPITPCKGTNCGSTTGTNHSPECQAEHIAAITGVPVENKVLDLSKPMRTKNNKVPANYLTTDRLGLLWVQEIDTKIVLGLYAKDLENIPEPKRTATREMVMVDDGMGTQPYILYDHMEFEEISFVGKIIARGTITLTEGDGLLPPQIKSMPPS